LLVLDEPLAALDPVARDDFMRSLLAAVAEDGVSVVFSSHVVSELEKAADYLIVLGRGRVLLTGTAQQLTAGPGTTLEQIVLACIRGHGIQPAVLLVHQPFIADGQTSKFPMQLFGNLGTDFAAWTLLAFALAALAGALIRRTVPAMAATLACWTVLDVSTMMSLRQHYQNPVLTSGANPPGGRGAWMLSQWFAAPDGTRVDPDSDFQQAQAGAGSAPGPGTFQTWLAQQHYTQWWSYQPASRFWPFQLIESGWLLGLSVILIAATFWLVRRRAALCRRCTVLAAQLIRRPDRLIRSAKPHTPNTQGPFLPRRPPILIS
jgi:hypothetical protein